MRNYYFIVLQLPESCKSVFENVKNSPANFLAKAAKSIAERKAKLLSMRCDTGISEDLRNHVETTAEFTTYLLLEIPLEHYEVLEEEIVFNKAAALLRKPCAAELIDKDERFQLITCAA